MSYVVYDPRGTVLTASRIALAPRLAAIGGATIGLLNNEKEQADVILNRVAEHLEARGARVLHESKWSQSVVAPPETIDRLARCDLVITALGG
ncbi:MAG: hypothetical protein U0821_21035 [Chloroflexota bacterium]